MSFRSVHPSFSLTEADVAYFPKIPPHLLKLVKLVHYEKMNYQEIAAQVGLPLGTVKCQVFRARRMIERMRAEAMEAEVYQMPTLATAAELSAGTSLV